MSETREQAKLSQKIRDVNLVLHLILNYLERKDHGNSTNV